MGPGKNQKILIKNLTLFAEQNTTDDWKIIY